MFRVILKNHIGNPCRVSDALDYASANELAVMLDSEGYDIELSPDSFNLRMMARIEGVGIATNSIAEELLSPLARRVGAF